MTSQRNHLKYPLFLFYLKAAAYIKAAKYPIPGNINHAFKSLIIVLLASKLLLSLSSLIY